MNIFYVRSRELEGDRQNPYWGHVGAFSSKELAVEGIEMYKKNFPTRKSCFVIVCFKMDAVYDFARVGPTLWSEGLSDEDKEKLAH